MMTFCRKSIHSFLGFSNSIDIDISEKPSSTKCQSTVSNLAGGGLGLVTATGDMQRPPNVVESASVKSSPPSSPPAASLFTTKDPGGIGFIDDIGGGVDGLMSCTESLGFESCDERRVDDEIELCSRTRSTARLKWRKEGERRAVRKFPPPLSSLNQNGQPSFFLRPVRKDGRLKLTEVRIDRPEILRAHRQNGRLRLHLVRDEEDYDIDDDEQQEQEQELAQEQEEEEEEEGAEEEVEEGRVGEWKFLAVSGEGFRRCNERVNHHHHHHHEHSNHHHNLHVWSQRCVTTS